MRFDKKINLFILVFLLSLLSKSYTHSQQISITKPPPSSHKIPETKGLELPKTNSKPNYVNPIREKSTVIPSQTWKKDTDKPNELNQVKEKWPIYSGKPYVVTGWPDEFTFPDKRGEMKISDTHSEAYLKSASAISLKAWGYNPKTVDLFKNPVKVSVPISKGKIYPRGVLIEAPSNQVFLSNVTLFSAYGIAKRTNHTEIVKILADSFTAAGPNWDYCKYNWGKRYIGFTFFKEALWKDKPIEVMDITFPMNFYPEAYQKFNQVLVATWWNEIAAVEKNKEKAEALRAYASEMVEGGP